MLAQAEPEVVEAAAEFGRRLGTAFQLIDDALDYTGDAAALGKNVGDDLREGKATLPLIRVMAVGTSAQQELVREAIRAGDGDFLAVAQAIHDTDALTHTRQVALAEAEAAESALALLPNSPCKSAMLQLCSFAVDRAH